AGDRHRGGVGRDRSAQRRPAGARHLSATSPAGGDRRTPLLRPDRGGEGRRRRRQSQLRADRPRRQRLRRGDAGGHHAPAVPLRDLGGGKAGGGRRAQRDGRQADGHSPAGGGRDGHDLPLADPPAGGRRAPRRGGGGGGGQPGAHQGALDPRRRRGDRRGQPSRR